MTINGEIYLKKLKLGGNPLASETGSKHTVGHPSETKLNGDKNKNLKKSLENNSNFLNRAGKKANDSPYKKCASKMIKAQTRRNVD